MALAFKRAVRTQAKGRIALGGPSGSGKTYTALLFAKALGEKIALIDTERGSASKYAGDEGMPEFDSLELETFSPEMYISAINIAEKQGYDVLIIDSLSHAWSGKEGVLEQVDMARVRSKTGNAFTDGWRFASPMHNRLVDTMLQAKMHIIATMRSKTKYVLEDFNGRQVPKQVGMEMVQRDGMEYEFDIVGELDKQNTLVITKSRFRGLSGKSVHRPDEETGALIYDWLTSGAPTNGHDESVEGHHSLRELFDLVKSLGYEEDALRQQMLERYEITRFKSLQPHQINALYARFEEMGVRQQESAEESPLQDTFPVIDEPVDHPSGERQATGQLDGKNMDVVSEDDLTTLKILALQVDEKAVLDLDGQIKRYQQRVPRRIYDEMYATLAKRAKVDD